MAPWRATFNSLIKSVAGMNGVVCRGGKEINDFSLAQLSQQCAVAGLPKSGTKAVLKSRLIAVSVLTKAAITIQKEWRRSRAMASLRSLGKLCSIDECVNDTDFFTLEPLKSIPRARLFVHQDEDGRLYGFDWASLKKLLSNAEVPPVNPYTRLPLPSGLRSMAERVVSHGSDRSSAKWDGIPREKRLELKAVDAFQKIDDLGFYTDHHWLWNLNARMVTRWSNILRNLWLGSAGLDEEVKREIVPEGIPIRFQSARGRDCQEVRHGAIKLIETLISSAKDIERRRQGAFLVLIALCAVSPEAATSMPWLSGAITLG